MNRPESEVRPEIEVDHDGMIEATAEDWLDYQAYLDRLEEEAAEYDDYVEELDFLYEQEFDFF